jgi:hypothetical protein
MGVVYYTKTEIVKKKFRLINLPGESARKSISVPYKIKNIAVLDKFNHLAIIGVLFYNIKGSRPIPLAVNNYGVKLR